MCNNARHADGLKATGALCVRSKNANHDSSKN